MNSTTKLHQTPHFSSPQQGKTPQPLQTLDLKHLSTHGISYPMSSSVPLIGKVHTCKDQYGAKDEVNGDLL